MGLIAQQLIDAGGEDGQGGLAFIFLVILIMAIWGSLFFMDRVRRRREEQETGR